MSYLVTAIFHDVPEAARAADELRHAGFPTDRIGIMAKDEHREAFRGHMGHTNVVDRQAGRGAVAGSVIGAVAGGIVALALIPGGVIVAGPIAAAVAGAAAGAAGGSLLGALVGTGIPEKEAKEYDRYVKQGRILLAVEADTQELAHAAEQVLDRCSPVTSVHVTRTSGRALTT